MKKIQSVLLITHTVAVAVILGNLLGIFNLLEWAVRDEFFRLRPHHVIDETTVVVTIDEMDLRQVGNWPIPDQILAELLEKIKAQQPRVIGMDLYRDLPKEPGHQQLMRVFQSTPNLIGVEKIVSDRVAPPLVLAQTNQVALADLVLDSDRKVRRGLLTVQDGSTQTDKAGLAVQVALKYLESEDVHVQPVGTEPNTLQLGRAIFTPLRPQDAGYGKEDLGGYQILMNWWGDESAYRRVTLRDVLAGKIPSDLMRDRMVFIGSTAASTNDFFGTPYSSSWLSNDDPTPGVIIHANLASQLVYSALEGRPLLRGMSGIWQGVWIWIGAAIGSGGCWYLMRQAQGKRHILGSKVLWISLGVGSIWAGGAYAVFLHGIFIPVIPVLAAFSTSIMATSHAYKQQKLEQTNNQLIAANHELANYSKTLENKVLERTQALEKAKITADAANQAKSEFLANMSHELRTPLNGVLGYAQILQHTESLTEEDRKGIDVIHQCGSHLLTLINDILDLSKIEARKLELYPTEVDLRSFLMGVAEICQVRAQQKGITLTVALSKDLPVGIYADEKRLRQVLINLLSNAIKFTDRGEVKFQVSVLPGDILPGDILPGDPQSPTELAGSLEPRQQWIKQITTKFSKYLRTQEMGNLQSSVFYGIFTHHLRNVAAEAQVLDQAGILTVPTNEHRKIRFQVTDTGIGMTPEQLQKIFLPFEQVGDASRKSEGTGLGLAISQCIVELMNGQLEVESQAGAGSCFWTDLSFPITQQPIEHHLRKIVGIAGRQPTALLVDDGAESRAIAAALLHPLGFSMMEATNGEEGLGLAVNFCPDLIVTEMDMPVMGGLDMIRHMRQNVHLSQVPIIVSSASVFETDQQRSREAGGTAFLPKPVQMEELFQLLQAHVNVEWIFADQMMSEEQIAVVNEPRKSLSKMNLPAPAILNELHHLAMMGNLEGIKQQIEPLRTEKSEFLEFTTEIYNLAESFQVKSIRELLKSLITPESHP